jgi:hypothetical protein
MNAKGVEEIKTALKQSERFDEVARVMTPPLGQQLKAANPFELALLLTDTAVWPVEKVRALIDELNKRMKSAAEERVKGSLRRSVRVQCSLKPGNSRVALGGGARSGVISLYANFLFQTKGWEGYNRC